MYKLYKCIVIALLVGCVVLTAGCKSEPVTPEPSADQTIQLPDGLEVQVGVGSRDEEDLGNETPGTTQDNGNEDTKPDDSEPDNSKPDDSKPDDSKPDDSEPDDSKPDNSKPDNTQLPAPGALDYLGFYQLTPEQQDTYIESFESLAAFNKWFNEVRAEYESQIPDDTIDGPIDLDKYNP